MMALIFLLRNKSRVKFCLEGSPLFLYISAYNATKCFGLTVCATNFDKGSLFIANNLFDKGSLFIARVVFVQGSNVT